MTSIDRVMKVFYGGIPEIRPVIPEVFGLSARLSGYKVYDYVTDGRILAESQIKTRQEMDYDILFAFADLLVEAETIGCKLHYNEDAYPYLIQPLLEDIDSVFELPLPDPSRDGRMPVLVEASRILREKEGDRCLIAACVVGPATLASHLLGMERFLYKLVDEPEKVNAVLDYSENVIKIYGAELLRAGANCIIVFDPVCSPDVLPPSYFINLESPRLKRVFEYFSSLGLFVSWISIAGPTQGIIPYYRASGINFATIDYEVPISEALLLCDGVVLNGNLKPYDFVANEPEEIEEKTKACIKEASGMKNFIVGTGCEIPLEARAENVKALVNAARAYK